MSRNFDYPMPMQGWAAKQMLAQVQADAAQLDAALRNDDRLPAWTLTKLATGTDRIAAAARYLLYKTRNTPSYGAPDAGAAPSSMDWTRIGVLLAGGVAGWMLAGQATRGRMSPAGRGLAALATGAAATRVLDTFRKK
jgi:hypothetical protein